MTQMIAPPLRDFLVGTTHRKDALDGLLWRKLRHQLAGRDGGTDEDADSVVEVRREAQGIILPPMWRLSGFESTSTAAADLASLLQKVAGVVRWEPINPNAEHRACPSPGNRFTVDVEIACRRGDESRWFRYLPREEMLTAMAGCGDALSIGTDDFAIVLHGQVARCAEPYGDLALCLTTIEMGAMLAQLALALGSAGLGAESIQFVSLERVTDPVLFVRVRAPAMANWLAHAITAPVRLSETMHQPQREVGGHLLRDFRSYVGGGVLCRELFPQGLKLSDCGTLLNATSIRTSGLDLKGVDEGKPDRAQLIALLDAICRLHSAFGGLGMLPFRLDVQMNDTLAATERESVARHASSWLHLAPGIHVDRATQYPYPRGAVILTVSVDLDNYAERLGAASITAMHLAAGIATQIICIAAADSGLACRPLRSFDHAVADAALPIAFWSLIQLVVYVERAPNLAFATSQFTSMART